MNKVKIMKMFRILSTKDINFWQSLRKAHDEASNTDQENLKLKLDSLWAQALRFNDGIIFLTDAEIEFLKYNGFIRQLEEVFEIVDTKLKLRVHIKAWTR